MKFEFETGMGKAYALGATAWVGLQSTAYFAWWCKSSPAEHVGTMLIPTFVVFSMMLFHAFMAGLED